MDNTTPQEAWNMAQATLQRLSRMLDQCSMYSQLGELVKWYSSILDLRRNLAPFLDESEMVEVTGKLKSLPSKWNSNGRTLPQYYEQVNRILDEIFIILIKSMKEKGLLMPKSKDPRTAVIN